MEHAIDGLEQRVCPKSGKIFYCNTTRSERNWRKYFEYNYCRRTGTERNRGTAAYRCPSGKCFSHGAIEGAVNLPLEKIEAGKTAILKKDQPVYLYCHVGENSRDAAKY